MLRERASSKKGLLDLLRRIYFGRNSRIGKRQILRAVILGNLTLSIFLSPFIDNDMNLSNTDVNAIQATESEANGNLKDESVIKLEKQLEESSQNLGMVDSGFLPKEMKQFASLISTFESFEIALVDDGNSKLQDVCLELREKEDKLLPIHQRVNGTDVVSAKFDKYWGLATLFLFEGNQNCSTLKANNSESGTQKDSKYLFGRAKFYFSKIITEGTAEVLPNQIALDKMLLNEALAEEEAYFAPITERSEAYFAKGAGLTSDEIRFLEFLGEKLKDYFIAFDSSNIFEVARACDRLQDTYDQLRQVSSSSNVYESYVDQIKDSTFVGLKACKKGLKKNRVNSLVDANSEFEISLKYLDILLQFAKQL